MTQTAEVPVMMMISNCEPKSPRNQYLAELMKHIKIDSYGRCFHNKARIPLLATEGTCAALTGS